MEEQLKLFDLSPKAEVNDRDYFGSRDWEVESDKNIFCNTPKIKNKETSENFKKLFCNKNKLSEKAVTEYQPKGTAGKTKKYYRFSYRQGNRTKHIHIKGGNTESQLAKKRKALVEAWIRENIELEKIIQWLKQW